MLCEPVNHRDTYLDWNATAPLRPEARAAISAALALSGNPSSVHRSGRAARQLVEQGRAAVAALAGASPDGVVFTSGGTEANHLALLGSGRPRVLVSAIEHSSIVDAVPRAEHIPVGGDGLVDPAALAALLDADASSRPALVSVMLANNETGAIQPIHALAEIAHANGALFHCDAVQAAGKIPLLLGEIGADFLTLSGHKIGGPAGIGALV
ncbi:MAG TPA: aminotransferase class V-fold PLP-dependent enzyme, partial [Stellaceae bacterium]|nr:aminotransferase class V-fold PLP-dependent enzyme [Stellaceae bacterium]